MCRNKKFRTISPIFSLSMRREAVILRAEPLKDKALVTYFILYLLRLSQHYCVNAGTLGTRHTNKHGLQETH